MLGLTMRAVSIYGPQQIWGHIRVHCFYINGLASQRAVGALSLEVPKASLDEDLGSLTWWEAHSPWQGFGMGLALRSLPT